MGVARSLARGAGGRDDGDGPEELSKDGTQRVNCV
jgi:hypothetical protein